MHSAKDIVLRPISHRAAKAIITKNHYSGKIVNNSNLHLGVFLDGRAHGALSFGPPMDKRQCLGLVKNTKWHEMLELNRMAFSDDLPRNSESRAIAIAFKIIRKQYPFVKWVLSFSDAAQCGDGTIYRAAGFLLTQIKKNNQIIEFPDGLRETKLVLTDAQRPRRIELAKRYSAKIGGGASLQPFLDVGAKPVRGFQLRYLKFLNQAVKDDLACEILEYAEIKRRGAKMYKGKRDK